MSEDQIYQIVKQAVRASNEEVKDHYVKAQKKDWKKWFTDIWVTVAAAAIIGGFTSYIAVKSALQHHETKLEEHEQRLKSHRKTLNLHSDHIMFLRDLHDLPVNDPGSTTRGTRIEKK